MDYNHAFVCLMGMGTVFFGLICLIVLTSVMSAVLCAVGKQPTACATPAPQPAAPATGAVTPELIAAVSTAMAEDLGTDITGIRIVSMKKV